MMSYHRAYIEQCEAFGFAGGPEFKTTVIPMSNGRERRNAEWTQPRHRYSLPFQNISDEGYTVIRQMFEVCRGMLDCFLYRDPLNNQVNNQTFGIGTGALSQYQLATLSVVAGVSYQRFVYAIPDDPDDLVITVNGTLTTAFEVDRDRGMVYFDAPPANGAVLRWSGTFDVWVRFNTDWLPFSIDNRREDGFAINGTVDLTEVSPPPLVES